MYIKTTQDNRLDVTRLRTNTDVGFTDAETEEMREIARRYKEAAQRARQDDTEDGEEVTRKLIWRVPVQVCNKYLPQKRD
jgi:hypothetical protein